MSEAGQVRLFVAVGPPPQPVQYKKGGGDYGWPENTCPVQMDSHYLRSTSCYHLECRPSQIFQFFNRCH